jgi:putative hydrolase of the HAD superfamily
MRRTAVIFDFFGTLTPSTPAHIWADHAARSAAPLGLPAATWRAALDASFPERATGRLGDLAATFQTLARRVGVDPTPEALTAACAARLQAQRELFQLRPDAIEVLTALRSAGMAIGVLSDCTVELAQAWPGLPLAGLVDARVLSCEEGRRKPDPELFRLIAHRLRTAPPACIYVGDGGGNELTGASSCGMQTYMLRASDWADNDAPQRESDWTGPTLPTLTSILSLGWPRVGR